MLFKNTIRNTTFTNLYRQNYSIVTGNMINYDQLGVRPDHMRSHDTITLRIYIMDCVTVTVVLSSFRPMI